MDYLLVEDDCAPDASVYFNTELFEKIGLTVNDFIFNGIKIEFGYEYRGYKIEAFPEEPYWHLSQAAPF